MGDILGIILFVLGVIVGIPSLIAMNLYSRTRHLREDVEELRSRIRSLEHPQPRVDPAPAAIVLPSQEPAVDDAVVSPSPLPRPMPERPAETPIVQPEPLFAPAPPERYEPEESLESRIGGRWLLNIGIAAIVIGIAYFEKLAIEKQWINETARVIQGGIVGALMIYAGNRFIRRGYALYGQMMTGGGVAVLYVSIYAAFIFYHLIGRGPAFAIMVAISALGAWLADRHESQGLAVLAVGGGFITPLLLNSGRDMQVGLFTYLAIMIAGTVFLGRRREWPLLNLVSYLFTLLIVAGWADRFYTSDKYLTTEVFLTLFCAMFVSIAWSTRRTTASFAGFASMFLWTAPAAYYAASLGVLADHPMAMLVWLIGVALVSGVLSVVAAEGADLVVWLAAALPLVSWANTHNVTTAWLTPGLVTIAAVYGIALTAQLRHAGSGQRPSNIQIAWMHTSALLMFAGAYFLVEPTHLAWTGPLAGACAIGEACLALLFWTRDRDRAVHFAALAFTLLSIAIALQFDGPAVIVGWASEGAAIVALGLYARREWMRIGGAALFSIAFVQTVDLLLSPVLTNHTIFLNTRAASALAVVALAYVIAWLHHREPEVAGRSEAIGAAILAAQVLSLVLLTTEIHAYFALHEGRLTREMLVSVTWAVYATVLIVIGLQRRYAVIRYFAIALFGLTIAKVFFSDLAELQRIYRVMSLIALGITLLLTSYLYQRKRGTEVGNDAAK